MGHEVLRGDSFLRDSTGKNFLIGNRKTSVLLKVVKGALDVPIVGVVSDGQRPFATRSKRHCQEPHMVCAISTILKAAKPICQLIVMPKKELKKRVRECEPLNGLGTLLSPSPRLFKTIVTAALTEDGRPLRCFWADTACVQLTKV